MATVLGPRSATLEEKSSTALSMSLRLRSVTEVTSKPALPSNCDIDHASLLGLASGGADSYFEFPITSATRCSAGNDLVPALIAAFTASACALPLRAKLSRLPSRPAPNANDLKRGIMPSIDLAARFPAGRLRWR